MHICIYIQYLINLYIYTTQLSIEESGLILEMIGKKIILES